MISPKELGEALGLGSAMDEELVGILGETLPLSRWEAGRRIAYFHPQHGHVLDVVYARDGRIASCEPTAAMTRELLEELRGRARAAHAPDAGFEVWRDVLFSVPEVRGFWRHADEWQILPAPPEVPRPDGQMKAWTYLRRSTASGPSLKTPTRRRAKSFFVRPTGSTRPRAPVHPRVPGPKVDQQRCRDNKEVRTPLGAALASLAPVARAITRESLAHPHHWVLLREPTTEGLYTAYVNEGYMIGAGFVGRADDLSDPADLPQLPVVPDDEYYARHGLEADEGMDLPSSLDSFWAKFEDTDPETREKLLRAAYWFDAAYRVWDTSKSLSFIAAINSVETLFPEREGHTCPKCKRFHDSPGPTARFRSFVETYAGTETQDARSAVYNLRSTFVHGGALHGLDLPRPWGTLEPTVEEHRDLHDTALTVARRVIRTWFLRHDATGSDDP